MAKYKIEREYIFSNKSYNEINDFLREYSKIDLKAVCDQKGNTALHQAAYSCDDIRVLKRYLEYMEKYCCENQMVQPQGRFREFVNCENKDGLTALHFAAYKGNFKALELLCSHGADYTRSTKSGQNALHLAAQGGKVQTFIYFQSLIDINCRDTKQSTPLHWACYMNNESIVTFLLAQPNIEVNAQDEKEQTPLHLATAYGHTKIAKKLLRAGADRKIANSKRQTPLKIARDNEFRNIERILNEEYTCIDRLKLYLNLKTVYKPESRSISKPILYTLSMSIVILLRVFLLKLSPQLDYVRYIEYGFYGILYLLYLSLIISPQRRRPQKYIDFLNGNIDMKKVCLACALLKPPRSFHCDICKVCVQRYDHHCFWINNCMGKRNLGRFIAFIVLFQVFLFYELAISIIVLVNYYGQTEDIIYPWPGRQIYAVISVYGTGLFSTGFTIPMLGLIVIHIKNLFLNKTTYERFTKDKISTLTESTSHLLEQEMKSKKYKKYSFANAARMCRDQDEVHQQEGINSSLAFSGEG